MKRSKSTYLALLAVLLSPMAANAVSILFVADDTGVSSALNISTVLTADGHSVTNVLGDYTAGNNPTLLGSLAGYDAVFWSASGSSFGGQHTNAAVFANMLSYVAAGGSVFVTGYDSVASPSDALLIAFLGATSSTDLPGTNVGPLSGTNSLTTGVVNITGVSPTGAWGDRDALHGLGGDTFGLDAGGGSGFQWTLRSSGTGEIAYVSAGRFGTFASDDVAWLNTSAGGAGAYNAALRNFAFNAAAASVPEPGTLALLGIGLFGMGLARRRKKL